MEWFADWNASLSSSTAIGLLNTGVEFVAARKIEVSQRRIEVMTDHRHIFAKSNPPKSVWEYWVWRIGSAGDIEEREEMKRNQFWLQFVIDPMEWFGCQQIEIKLLDHWPYCVMSNVCLFMTLRRSIVLDVRLQVEVKDQNMVKHPSGIYHRKYTTQRNSSRDLHTMFTSCSTYPPGSNV